MGCPKCCSLTAAVGHMFSLNILVEAPGGVVVIVAGFFCAASRARSESALGGLACCCSCQNSAGFFRSLDIETWTGCRPLWALNIPLNVAFADNLGSCWPDVGL